MSGTCANAAAHNDVMDFENKSPWARLVDALSKVFTKDTVGSIATYTGLQIRSCEFFVERKSTLNGNAIVGLLNSPAFAETVIALTAESDDEMVKEFRKMYRRKQLQAEMAELEKRMKALDD